VKILEKGNFQGIRRTKGLKKVLSQGIRRTKVFEKGPFSGNREAPFQSALSLTESPKPHPGSRSPLPKVY
jgi:hypothetical protein